MTIIRPFLPYITIFAWFMGDEIKHIAFLIIPDATLLDITGPYEVFSQALEQIRVKRESADSVYQLHYLSAGKSRNVRTASGLTILCDENIKTFHEPIDTLVIPGVPNSQIENYRLPKD